MEDKNMGCKYCEDMSLVDEHDGWAEHEGAEFESNVRECNSSCRVIRHELDGYADYSLAFRVDEEWEEKVSVAVGRGGWYSGGEKMEYKFRSGFDCDEWFEISYCPMCGRDLRGEEV